jgi:membrane-associated HD superfamily phosphohydrolase
MAREISSEKVMEIFNIKANADGNYDEYAHKAYDRANETTQNIIQAYDKLSAEINHMGSEEQVAKVLLQCIIQDHRTLQQGFWRVIFKTIFLYGKLDKARYSDARNEASIEACKAMKADEQYFPFV